MPEELENGCVSCADAIILRATRVLCSLNGVLASIATAIKKGSGPEASLAAELAIVIALTTGANRPDIYKSLQEAFAITISSTHSASVWNPVSYIY
jgi:hypothetical protein